MGDDPRITPRVYNHATHLKHRSQAATLATLLIAALAVAFATDTTLAFPLPAGAGPDGAAPAWGASMAVGPYAEVNLRTGHVLTRLPVVGWSGRGPAIDANTAEGFWTRKHVWDTIGVVETARMAGPTGCVGRSTRSSISLDETL